MIYDYVVVGGGIVGLSTAWQLQQQYPDKKILLLEKESQFAKHQTSHNSGVIHAGVYYTPDSLKAQFCKQGLKATLQFCREHNIDVQQCGKLLVATDDLEHQRLHALFARCQQNNISVQYLTAAELKQRQPQVSGVAAIWVADTGIVDYQQICFKMAECFCKLGGLTLLDTCVTALFENSENIVVKTNTGEIKTKFLIGCCGLMADRLVHMLGIKTHFKIIPFRGEYYQLSAALNQLIDHLIYPIPDPALPFLGVHLTRMIDGSITVGPNAVLSFKREGYKKLDINISDVFEMLYFPGFWKMLMTYFVPALRELKSSCSKRYYLKRVQRYCPGIQLSDLTPYPAGVRAQAVMRDGSLVQDFLFVNSPRSLHVCNAPSPAATSAIPIGRYICEKVAQQHID